MTRSIYFLKNSKAPLSGANSIVLRFKIKETGKYKVKGLGISCTKKQWNQAKQRVIKSHKDYQKYNAQLELIDNGIDEIEDKRNVTPEDIDSIVKASLIGKTVPMLELEELADVNLQQMIQFSIDQKSTGGAYSGNTLVSIGNVKSSIQSFEKYFTERLRKKGLLKEDETFVVTAKYLNDKALYFQDEYVEYNRNLGNADSSIKAYLTIINRSITIHNKYNNQSIRTLSKKDTRWKKVEKPVIALTNEEVSKLYNFAFDLKSELTSIERKACKYFLFRCFCGMRVGDMNQSAVNPISLKKDASTFSYFQDKGTKRATVSCINSYLYDIAESLDWDFPDFELKNSLGYYINNEIEIIRKVVKGLTKDNPRIIEIITNNGVTRVNFAEEITTHTARKTFAHILYSLTKDIMLVKKQLGHKTIDTTMRYLDFNMDVNDVELKGVNLGF